MLTSLPSMTASAYQKHQPSAPRFQGNEQAESSKRNASILPPNDELELSNRLSKATGQKPRVDLAALPQTDKLNLKKMLNNARIQLQKTLPKAKSQTEKDGHIANYNMNIYHAFYETIAKQAPEAKEAAIGDWNKLFTTLQEVLPDAMKTESFGDMPNETQYKLVAGISQGLRSPHAEVQQTAAEIGEAFGMTLDMLNRLKG